MLLHFAQRADEIGQTFQRVILALHRDQHAVGGAERIKREQIERRRTINQDVIVLIGDRCNRGLQSVDRVL